MTPSARVDYLFCWTLCIALSACSHVEDDVSVAHVYADKGTSVSLPCLPQTLRPHNQDYTLPANENSQLVWVREGKSLQHSKVERNGILVLNKVSPSDAGLYTCQAEESFADSDKTFTRNVAQVELHVKSMHFSLIIVESVALCDCYFSNFTCLFYVCCISCACLCNVALIRPAI